MYDRKAASMPSHCMLMLVLRKLSTHSLTSCDRPLISVQPMRRVDVLRRYLSTSWVFLMPLDFEWCFDGSMRVAFTSDNTLHRMKASGSSESHISDAGSTGRN